MNKSYQSVLQDLDRICGCANAAKEAAKAINELVAQRDELVAALDAMAHYFAQYEKDDSAKYVFKAASASISKATGGAA